MNLLYNDLEMTVCVIMNKSHDIMFDVCFLFVVHNIVIHLNI